jgi:hypothetical protein
MSFLQECFMATLVNLNEEFTSSKLKSEPRQVSIQENRQADAASMAAYIADMSAELALLAARSALPMLAHFLNLARVEAEIRSRECRAPDVPPQTFRTSSEKRR